MTLTATRFFDMHRRMEVAQWIRGRPMVDWIEAVRLIERVSARLADDPRFGSWAVVERCSGVAAGTVLLKPLPGGAGEIEIGWHLHPDAWGRGLATEAAAALLARGFALGLAEIWAVTHLDNQRSARVCEKLGMRLLGVTQRGMTSQASCFGLARGQVNSQRSAPINQPQIDRATARRSSWVCPCRPNGRFRCCSF